MSGDPAALAIARRKSVAIAPAAAASPGGSDMASPGAGTGSTTSTSRSARSTPSSAVCSPRPTTTSSSTPQPCALAPKIAIAPNVAAYHLQQQIPIQPSTPKSGMEPDAEGYGAGGVGQVLPGIVTQKEWVIPPRPKPGRKPATDTPPTKRKAQNRAAQRAFRERRAARVNELEDKIKEIEAAHATDLAEARMEIDRLRESNAGVYSENSMLRAELEKLRGDVAVLQEREKANQEEIERLRRRRRSTTREGDTVQQIASPPSETEGPGVSVVVTPPVVQIQAPAVQTITAPLSVPLPPRRSLRNRMGGCGGAAAAAASSAGASSRTGGGGCMKGSNAVCPCMAKSNNNKASPSSNTGATATTPTSSWPYTTSEVQIHSLPKRPTSPLTRSSSPTSLPTSNSHKLQKRTRLNPTLPTSSSVDDLETDFTNLYALGAAASAVSTPASTASATSCLMADPCGFCSDGTPCVCAEMAMMDQEDHEMDMGLGGVTVGSSEGSLLHHTLGSGALNGIGAGIGGGGGGGGINMSSSWSTTTSSIVRKSQFSAQSRYYDEDYQLSEEDGEGDDGVGISGRKELDMDLEEGAKLAPLLMLEIDESLRIANAGGLGMSVMHPPNVTRPVRGNGGGGLSTATGGAKSSSGGGGGGCGSASAGGGGGPGSCSMCQKDPQAMRFCQSIASLRRTAGGQQPSSPTSSSTSMKPPPIPSSSSPSSAGGCCGGGGASGGCCRDPPPPPPTNPTSSSSSSPTTATNNSNSNTLPSLHSPHQQQQPQKPTLPPLSSATSSTPGPARYIPCSAAYAKLRQHRGWDKASMDDFPGLVRPLLVDAVEGGGVGGGQGGRRRCPRVEVGSLQDVLTMLDRRFGKDVA